MKRKLFLFFSCVTGIVSFILVSCTDIDLTKVSDDVLFRQSLVVPVGEGSVTVADIMGKFDFQNLIGYDADTINFLYEMNKEYEFETINLLKNATARILPFPLAPATISANTSIPVPGGNQYSVDLGLDPNSTSNRTDSAKIITAKFSVKVSVTNIKDMSNNAILPSDLKIVFVFPKMHYPNSNTAITKNVSVTQFGIPTEFVISGFVINTSGLTGVPFQIQFWAGNRNINIGSNAKIDFEIKATQLDFVAAYGLYNPTSMQPTVIKMQLGDLSALPAGLRFANPAATVALESNIGTYLRFNIDYIKAFSKDGSQVKEASFNGSPTVTEIINIKPEVPGLFATKTLRKLDKDYGSTDRLFDTDIKLDTLEYKFSVQPDAALNNASATPSFIIPDMKMKMNFKMKIPMYLKSGSNINLNDTISDIKGAFNKIENAGFGLKITNGLPVKVTFSMKFLDANQEVINSTINDSEYIINSGEVNNEGLVTKETVTPLDIELTKEQVNQLKNAKSMIYSLRIAGQTDSSPIQFTKNNSFKVKLGVFIKSEYKTSLDSIN
ncbi:MAG: hypothetical protein QM800_13705 [Paludibacter sp.]